MKVIKSEENLLEFDTGVKIEGTHNQDCCEYNYLDFDQFEVGTEFPGCTTAAQLVNIITIKDDGFILKDSVGIPKWAQARSSQNGYYSNSVGIEVSDKEITLTISKSGSDSWSRELFNAEESED